LYNKCITLGLNMISENYQFFTLIGMLVSGFGWMFYQINLLKSVINQGIKNR
jgi:hypothetical protein